MTWREVWRSALKIAKQIHRYRVPASTLSRRTIRGAGWYAIIQGAGILAGGAGRWASPTYTLLKSVPGAPASWGGAVIGFGVTILIGSYTRRWLVKSTGMFLLCAWHVCFATGALVAAFQFPGAGSTAAPIYYLVAYWTAALIWVDERLLRAPPVRCES
jgi:hypothetical protein